MTPAIVTFAATGAEIAQSLQSSLEGEVFRCGFNGEDARTLLPRLFAEGRPIQPTKPQVDLPSSRSIKVAETKSSPPPPTSAGMFAA